MILVEKWLAGSRNFKAGCILYNQYGTDQPMKTLLAKGETPAAKQQLIAAMQALLQPAPVLPKETATEKMLLSQDPVCASIHQDWKQHYTRMNMLRGKLQSFGDDNSPEAVHECNELCQQILEEERYVNSCWEKLKHYQEHGKLPEQSKEDVFEIPGDPVALAKLIETLKRNIRRNKQKAAAEPANALYPSLIKKYEQQLQQILDAKKN